MDRPGALDRLRAAVTGFRAAHLPDADRWCVALSGGPDSLALTAAAAGLADTVALIVDHGLQDGSAAVAEAARAHAVDLGCVDARILRVTVAGAGGLEAAARTVRYAALRDAHAGRPVLLGHTLDDQAETVLLGLGRGSGPRSIAGMRPYVAPWGRPLLGVRRRLTAAACTELGLTPWHDPHNSDHRFTRVRLRREVLPLLEEVLGGGVAEALARTAAAVGEDTDYLDGLAEARLRDTADPRTLDPAGLGALPAPIRRRVLRAWLLAGGATGLTDEQIRRVDALVIAWRGQGAVAVPSALPRQRLVAARTGGRLVLRTEPVAARPDLGR